MVPGLAMIIAIGIALLTHTCRSRTAATVVTLFARCSSLMGIGFGPPASSAIYRDGDVQATVDEDSGLVSGLSNLSPT